MTERRIAEDSDARVSSREALRFLTRAGRVLSSSLDPDQTLRRLVHLAVPRVACFAMIDLSRGNGLLQRVAFEHIDKSKEPLLDRPKAFDPRAVGLMVVARVFAEGHALLVKDVERDWDGGSEVLERVRQLGGRSLIVVPLASPAGEILGTLTFGSTRTDRFYHLQDLSLARELARSAGLALENARLYRRAEQAITSRDEVLAIVSHDLRNPLNRIRLATEMLRETGVEAATAERTLDIVVRAADEMNRLIGDLLDVTRIEAGKLSIDPAPVSVTNLIRRLDESYAAVAQEKRIAWSVSAPQNDVTIHADEGRLLQALGNLIGNAMKFTAAGGSVRVATEVLGTALRIGVIDDGPGMNQDQLAHVFERFWQGRSSDRRGAGLGLAITRGIVEAHAGRLWLESEMGRGTTAWMELPLQS